MSKSGIPLFHVIFLDIFSAGLIAPSGLNTRTLLIKKNLQGGIHVMLFFPSSSFKAADQGGGDGGAGGSTKQVVAKWQAAAP